MKAEAERQIAAATKEDEAAGGFQAGYGTREREEQREQRQGRT